jgi:hypothetical protein
MAESKSAIQPVLLVQYLARVPEEIWPAHLYLPRRLSVEIALADAGSWAKADSSNVIIVPRALEPWLDPVSST